MNVDNNPKAKTLKRDKISNDEFVSNSTYVTTSTPQCLHYFVIGLF